jgi:hypothetical protein
MISPAGRVWILWEIAEINDKLNKLLKSYFAAPSIADHNEIFRLRARRTELEDKLGLKNV